MDLRKYIDPATGLVTLRLKDGSAVKRWPIDAREMLAGGATLGDPPPKVPATPAPQAAQRSSGPQTKRTSAPDTGEDE